MIQRKLALSLITFLAVVIVGCGNQPQETSDARYLSDSRSEKEILDLQKPIELCGTVIRQGKVGNLILSNYGLLIFSSPKGKRALISDNPQVQSELDKIAFGPEAALCIAPGEERQGIEALFLKVIQILPQRN